jgi:hypothetical protein
MSWAETPMAELKERHRVRRAQRRGRESVLIQALGAASAYDIKKLVRWHRRCPQAIALACQCSARATRAGETQRRVRAAAGASVSPPPWRRSPDACVSRMGKSEATTMVARNRRLRRHPDDRIDLHAGCRMLLLTELGKGEYDQFSKEGEGRAWPKRRVRRQVRQRLMLR